MRASIRSYIQAEKARREENGDAGFSLIELIVVVVILGVLAAVAIPVFLGLQGDAEKNARETVAANAASQYAASIAQDEDYAFSNGAFANLSDGGKYEFEIGTNATLGGFCITVTEGDDDAKTSASGPGCPAPTPAG